MKVKAWPTGDPTTLGLGPTLPGVLFTGEEAVPGLGWVVAQAAQRTARSPGDCRVRQLQVVVIGGYTDPQRSRIGFGALLLGYYDRDGKLRYVGKVGTGFDQRTLISLHAAPAALERPDTPLAPVRGLPGSGVHWVEPRLVAQVGFTDWTADVVQEMP